MRYFDINDIDDLYGALRVKYAHNNTVKRELDVMCA